MAEFKLSYTANEINEKLGKVDNLVSTVNGVAPDADGNVEVAAGGIIDTIELPIENINENAFYRLLTAKVVFNQEDCTEFNYICYCVDGLPEVGLAATNTEMSIINAYYNTQDGLVSGYLDETLAPLLSMSIGWYDLNTLLTVAGQSFAGVITDISDDPCDDAIRVLLSYDFYIYKNDWSLVPFAYEKMPKFDIVWDGDMTNRPALDMSILGYANGIYFVKISDFVPTVDEVVGGNFQAKDYNGVTWSHDYISSSDIDTTTYPGAFHIANYIVVVYDEATLGNALGIPAGTFPNGIYFWLYTNETDGGYVSHFTAPSKITKINNKYLDFSSFASVATSGSYNDLSNKPTIYTDVIRYNTTQNLSSTYKANARTNIDVYSKSEVDTKIGSGIDLSNYATKEYVDELITGAIGGSY